MLCYSHCPLARPGWPHRTHRFFFVVVSFGQAVRERRGAFARWASHETEEVSMPGGWGFDEMLRHPLMNGVNGVNGVNDYIL